MGGVQPDRFVKEVNRLRDTTNRLTEEVGGVKKSFIGCGFDQSSPRQAGLLLRGQLNPYFARNATGNLTLSESARSRSYLSDQRCRSSWVRINCVVIRTFEPD